MSFPRYPSYRSSGVEWLGDLPSHWQVDRFKRSVKSCRNGIWGEEPRDDGNDVPCVRVADFDRTRLLADLSSPTIRNVTPSERADRTLSQGDLLLEKSGGGDLQPVGCVVLYAQSAPAVCSNFVAKVRLQPGMCPSYWRYAHAAAYAVRLNERSIKQTSGIQNLDSHQYLDERAPFPPTGEQVAIAAFLDRETAKIDALVAEQERLIELLKEKRQAVISHAVTKGLNRHAPMKPSGIEWLGDVPAHWTVGRVRLISSFMTSGPRGWSERVGTEGALFIQSGNLDDDLALDFAGAQRVAVDVSAEATRTRLAHGDVVVCITGAKTGNVAVCDSPPEPAYVNQHLCLVRPSEAVLPRLLGTLLKSVVGQVHFETSQYGLKQGLSLADVKDCPVAIPPMKEQQAIVRHVDATAGAIAALVAEAERAVTLLTLRRSGLISDAVTGQIDVRGTAATAA